MKTLLRWIAGAGLLAALGGCVETRFESPLGDNIETCDVKWKGLWGDPDSATEPGAIYVDDECRFIVLDQPERGTPLKQIHVPMNFVHADGKDYLVVPDSALRGLVDLKQPHGVDPARRLRQPLHRRQRVDQLTGRLLRVHDLQVRAVQRSGRALGHGQFHVQFRVVDEQHPHGQTGGTAAAISRLS